MKRLSIIILVLLMAAATGCKAPSAAPQGEQAPAKSAEPADAERMSFETTDINGEPVSFADFNDKKLIMVNFWETWCPPCMGELPDLERLYEKYADKGFVILGVYSQSELSEVSGTVESVGLRYPVFEVTPELTRYQTRYVPTTVFVNASGELLTDEPYVGSKTGAEWEEIILSLLGE